MPKWKATKSTFAAAAMSMWASTVVGSRVGEVTRKKSTLAIPPNTAPQLERPPPQGFLAPKPGAMSCERVINLLTGAVPRRIRWEKNVANIQSP